MNIFIKCNSGNYTSIQNYLLEINWSGHFKANDFNRFNHRMKKIIEVHTFYTPKVYYLLSKVTIFI